MQYQIVDPTDVVAWTFINRAEIRELSESRAIHGGRFVCIEQRK
jgi:hypothetical protein